MATQGSNLPDGYSNPNQDQDDDDEQDARMDPGEVIEGVYLGVENQGETEYGNWYRTKIRTDEGVRFVFAQDEYKSAITQDNVSIGDRIAVAKDETPTESDEYGDFYAVEFGILQD